MRDMTYPTWSYFPRNVRPPSWAVSFVEVVKAAENEISTVNSRTGLSSDDVLKSLEPGLVALGYAVESGRTAADKIFRPVLFGEFGVPEVSYEIDAFHDRLGIAVEVEAGRGAAGKCRLPRYYSDFIDPRCSQYGTASSVPLSEDSQRARSDHTCIRTHPRSAQRALCISTA